MYKSIWLLVDGTDFVGHAYKFVTLEYCIVHLQFFFSPFFCKLDFSQNQFCLVVVTLQDKDTLMKLLTYPEVEEAIKRRVDMKAKTFGQEVVVNMKEQRTEPVYKINPRLVADLYSDWIMPLTKEVQVAYLLRKLD